jgi:hypothetical protein
VSAFLILRKMILLIFLGLGLFSLVSYSFSVLEPKIECTVTKVISQINLFAQSKFPKRYDSINNLRQAELTIAGVAIKNAKFETLFKSDNLETIKIVINGRTLFFKLVGKPLSRSGTIAEDGNLLAEITCH